MGARLGVLLMSCSDGDGVVRRLGRVFCSDARTTEGLVGVATSAACTVRDFVNVDLDVDADVDADVVPLVLSCFLGDTRLVVGDARGGDDRCWIEVDTRSTLGLLDGTGVEMADEAAAEEAEEVEVDAKTLGLLDGTGVEMAGCDRRTCDPFISSSSSSCSSFS